MKDFVFITGNQNKADFLKQWLGKPIEHHKLDLDEIQSLDLHAVAEHKARQAYELLKRPVLIEDATLRFTAMGRLPGTFVKWFIEEMGVDGLAKLATSLPSQEAVAVVAYALFDGTTLNIFEGEMKGAIAAEPRGSGGFGFDAIFINEEFPDKTRGELSPEDYAATSYRTRAMKPLREYLESLDNKDIAA